MSCTAAHQSNQVCRARDRVLCFECYRAERDRRRAESLADVPWLRPMSPPFSATLTERQVAHRTMMLENLRRSAAAVRRWPAI
jgi:hypothetical protein